MFQRFVQFIKRQLRDYCRNLNYLLKKFRATIMTCFIECLRYICLVIEQHICDMREITHCFYRLDKRTDFIIQKTI